jgi:hypothetical protein
MNANMNAIVDVARSVTSSWHAHDAIRDLTVDDVAVDVDVTLADRH